MPAVGHSRRFSDLRRMSNLHPASEVSRLGPDFAVGPVAEVADPSSDIRSFDMPRGGPSAKLLVQIALNWRRPCACGTGSWGFSLEEHPKRKSTAVSSAQNELG